ENLLVAKSGEVGRDAVARVSVVEDHIERRSGPGVRIGSRSRVQGIEIASIGKPVIVQTSALQALELASDEVKLGRARIAADLFLPLQRSVENRAAEFGEQVLDALVEETPLVAGVVADHIVACPDAETAAENHA